MKQRINNAVLNSVLLAQFLAVATTAEIDAALSRMEHAAKDGEHKVLTRSIRKTADRITRQRGRKLSSTKSPKSSTKSPKSDSKSPKSTKSPKTTTTSATAAPTTVQDAFIASIDCSGEPSDCGRLRDAIAGVPAFVDFFRLQEDPEETFETAFSDPAFVDAVEAASDTEAMFFIGDGTAVTAACQSAGADCCPAESPATMDNTGKTCVWEGIGVVASTACVGTEACNTYYEFGGTKTYGANLLILPDACVGNYACKFTNSDAEAPTFVGEDACTGEYACNSLGSENNGVTTIGAGGCDGNRACLGLGQKYDSEIAEASIAVGAGACVGESACELVHSYVYVDGMSDEKNTGSVTIGAGACSSDFACFQLGASNNFTDDLVIPASS